MGAVFLSGDGFMVNSREHRESFIVRIWQEQGQPEWKGWVQHVRSGESAFLENLDDLSTLVKRWTLGLAGQKPQGLR
jgi:hypothetical protein